MMALSNSVAIIEIYQTSRNCNRWQQLLQSVAHGKNRKNVSGGEYKGGDGVCNNNDQLQLGVAAIAMDGWHESWCWDRRPQEESHGDGSGVAAVNSSQ